MTSASFPARRALDLSTCAWQFGSVPRQPWRRDTGRPSPFDLASVREWLPATVPGNVHSDLAAAGRIPDPFVDDGLAACGWVEGVDWWYRTTVQLQLDPGQRTFLELDGVDTLSAVFVAGRELGRHEGMFSRHTVEIPADLHGQAQVELAVRLWGSDALPSYELSLGDRLWSRVAGLLQRTFPPFDDRLAAMKAPMHFGWDFAPRLRTMGIWDEARLVFCRGVYIAWAAVAAEPLAEPADRSAGPARVHLRIAVDSDRPRRVTALVRIRSRDGVGDPWREAFSVALPAGPSQHNLEMILPEARLWQPWERGDACLYELDYTVLEAEPPTTDGETGLVAEGPASRPAAALDTLSTRFGIRRIERLATTKGHPWRFVVNGEPLFLRGVNWTPVDALPGRAARSRYEGLLRQARAAGVNFLRVWGGGGREAQAFYDLCDKLGLLVWQEMPIACVFLDHLPRDAAYLALLRQEATGMVRALRHHPCVFMWCGGNEFSRRRNRQAVAALADVVAAEDGTRPWLPASPGPGDSHHWLVWHGLAPLAMFRRERAPFVSEFGLQAAPVVESLRRFIPAQDLWPPGPAWGRHKADLPKLWRYAAGFGAPPAAAEPEAALYDFVAATQRAQAAGLQIMVEHIRRRRGQTGGLAVWQWNEPWPAISWSIVDYFGVPKMAYDVLRRTMQPLLVCLDLTLRAWRPGERLTGTLWAVNDGIAALNDCRLAVELDGRQVCELPCSLPANAAAPIGRLEVTLPRAFALLRLELWRGNRLLAENVYDLRYHDRGTPQAGQTLRRLLVDLVLR